MIAAVSLPWMSAPLAVASPFVLGLLALLAPVALRPFHPATAARMATVALAGAVASTLSWIVLVALSSSMHQLVGHQRRRLAAFAEAHVDPPPLVGVVAAVALAVVVVRCGSVLWGAADDARRQRCRRAGLVVEDAAAVYAYAVPGPSPRVVLSDGLVRRLSSAEVDACVAHERSHLVHRHHLYALALELCAAACPWLRRAARRSQFHLERWADEDAAVATGDRVTVARAIARAAVEEHDRRSRALAFSTRFVEQRVTAMLGPGPAASRLAGTVALAGTAALTVPLALAAMQFDHAAAFL